MEKTRFAVGWAMIFAGLFAFGAEAAGPFPVPSHPGALCQGVYSGTFSNFERVVMTLTPTNFRDVHVSILTGGSVLRKHSAIGTCQDYGGSAEVTIRDAESGDDYRGTILAVGGDAAQFDGVRNGTLAFHLERLRDSE